MKHLQGLLFSSQYAQGGQTKLTLLVQIELNEKL